MKNFLQIKLRGIEFLLPLYRNQQSAKREASEAAYNQNKHAKQTRIDDFKTLNVNIEEKQKIFDESLVYFVAETGVAFNVLGTTSFKNTIEIANRRLKVKTPRTISQQVIS